jgi:nuclear GTP-binding protein
MLALSTGRLLKVRLSPSLLQNSKKNQKTTFFSDLPALQAAQIPSTISDSGGQVAPGAETTGQAQMVSALGEPFVQELWKVVKRMQKRLMPSPIRN